MSTCSQLTLTWSIQINNPSIHKNLHIFHFHEAKRSERVMEYKHFSHEHNLSMYQVHPGQQLRCSGCDKFCDKTIYACWHCKFFLHEHCGNATRYIRHPFHPPHHLILCPYPTYPSNCFLCNACGTNGTRFLYCCVVCEVDLHVNCAFLPPKVCPSFRSIVLLLFHIISKIKK